MSMHYVKAGEWCVACADPAERLGPPDWLFRRALAVGTFVVDRVTCPDCLRMIAERGDAASSDKVGQAPA